MASENMTLSKGLSGSAFVVSQGKAVPGGRLDVFCRGGSPRADKNRPALLNQVVMFGWCLFNVF